MIWSSIPLMTFIDVVIILVTAASLYVIIGQRRELAAAGTSGATLLLLAGLVLISGLYIADLWIMLVLPARTSPMEAMQTMEDLHLNWSWLAVAAAVSCMFLGLTRILRNQLALIGSLQASRAEMERESGLRATVEDALASAQETLLRALDASHMVTWVLDAHSGEVQWSDGVGELLGLQRGEFDGAYDSYLALVHPDDATHLQESTDRAFATGGSYDLEFRVILNDGSVRWLASKGKAFHDLTGGPASIAGVIWDVTARREALAGREAAEVERDTLNRRLHRKQRLESLGTLAGGIAHDFNNLLTPILGYADLLSNDAQVGPEAGDSLDQIRVAAERAKGLIQQILAFGGRVDTDRRLLDAAETVGQALDLVRAILPATVELRRSLDDGGYVSADATQLTQIIVNLCTNAAQSMPEGGVLEVQVRVVEVDEASVVRNPGWTAGPKVRLTVSDTGSGIPPEIVEQVFDPFFTTKEVGEGTGLGLSQVHGIVTAHGGTVVLHSQVGRGTVVNVLLPLVVGEAAVSADLGDELELELGNERILLVDDEPAVADLGRRILESLGYTVEVEADPVAAISRYQRSPGSFQAIITDLTMPGITGLELIDAVRSLEPDVPVLLMSGRSDSASFHALDARGVDFLMKPYTRSELARSIREVLDRPMSPSP